MDIQKEIERLSGAFQEPDENGNWVDVKFEAGQDLYCLHCEGVSKIEDVLRNDHVCPKCNDGAGIHFDLFSRKWWHNSPEDDI
jgi:hypothetical protein